MTDYLYLFIGGHAGERSPEETRENRERWFGWIGRMREAGVYKGGHPLHDGGKTISGAERLVTDGPFAEARELVGGFIVVGVRDLDHALEYARDCPIFRDGGRVEVRRIQQLEGL